MVKDKEDNSSNSWVFGRWRQTKMKFFKLLIKTGVRFLHKQVLSNDPKRKMHFLLSKSFFQEPRLEYSFERESIE